MAKRIRSYRDLIVWQKSIDLVDACYAVTRRFPSAELYGLTSQMRRASVSIAANIAEGHGDAADHDSIFTSCRSRAGRCTSLRPWH